MSQTATIAEQYRELLAITGELRPGDAIVGAYRLTCKGKVDVRSRAGNVMLQLALNPDRRIALVSQYSDGRWINLAQDSIDHTGEISLTVKGPNCLVISLGNAATVEVEIEVAEIARLHGVGEWERFERLGEASTCGSNLLITTLPATQAGPQPERDDKLIFDVGFYDGNDTAYYLWRGFNVVAVEANPVLAARGAEYFSEFIASGRLRIVNCAIGDSEGVLPFFVNRVRPEWSSTNRNVAARGLPIDEIKISTIRPESLFAQFGVPHFLKIDIEGQDLTVIRAVEKLDTKPQFLSFEVSPNGAVAALRLLADAGYREFNIVDQSKVHMTLDHRVLPQEAGLGGAETFQFRRGSSGVFGERLGGAWLDLESTERWMKSFLERHAARNADFSTTGKITFGDWFDIHAHL